MTRRFDVEGGGRAADGQHRPVARSQHHRDTRRVAWGAQLTSSRSSRTQTRTATSSPVVLACEVHWTLPPTVPAVSVIPILDRERRHAGSAARGGHRRFALLGLWRRLELAHAPTQSRAACMPKALNACCPAGPETPPTHETTRFQSHRQLQAVHFLVSYTTLGSYARGWPYRWKKRAAVVYGA